MQIDMVSQILATEFLVLLQQIKGWTLQQILSRSSWERHHRPDGGDADT
jgi:hypothetical protein